MDPLDVLLNAYHLLDDKKRWTQGYWAYDKDGNKVAPRDSRATSWCALGALRKVTPPLGSGVAVIALESACGGMVEEINDGPDGYRKIRAVYRKAIRKLEKERAERARVGAWT